MNAESVGEVVRTGEHGLTLVILRRKLARDGIIVLPGNQQLWKSARRPDDGGGVARIVTRQKGIIMRDWKETNRLRELQEEVAAEKGIRPDTLRRLLAKVDEFSESHRAFGLPDDMLSILKDDLENETASFVN